MGVGLGVGFGVGRAVGFGVGSIVGEAVGAVVGVASGELDDEVLAVAVAVAVARAGLADALADPFGPVVGLTDVQADRLRISPATKSLRITIVIAGIYDQTTKRPMGPSDAEGETRWVERETRFELATFSLEG